MEQRPDNPFYVRKAGARFPNSPLVPEAFARLPRVRVVAKLKQEIVELIHAVERCVCLIPKTFGHALFGIPRRSVPSRGRMMLCTPSRLNVVCDVPSRPVVLSEESNLGVGAVVLRESNGFRRVRTR